MSKTLRVFNESRRVYMTHKQAAQAVDSCGCGWVEFGVRVRDLTIAEAIAARNHQAALREPLPAAELPGLHYEPALGREAAGRVQSALARDAAAFVGA